MTTAKMMAPKTLFMILGSQSKEHEMDLLAQKSTWLRGLPPEQHYVILRGGNSKIAELKADTVYLPVEENTQNILEKTILGLEWALNNSDFDFLIRTNVSTYFPFDLVHKILSGIDPSKIYFGGYIDFCDHRMDQVVIRTSYVTGTAILMTRKCVELLVKSDWKSLSGLPDDLAITLALRAANVDPINIQRNNLSFGHIFWPSFQIRLKSPAVSSLASIRMHLVHDYFKPQSQIMKIVSYIRISLFEIQSLITHHGEFRVLFMHVLVMGKRKLSKFLWKMD
jgi:hypothetical protein